MMLLRLGWTTYSFSSSFSFSSSPTSSSSIFFAPALPLSSLSSSSSLRPRLVLACRYFPMCLCACVRMCRHRLCLCEHAVAAAQPTVRIDACAEVEKQANDLKRRGYESGVCASHFGLKSKQPRYVVGRPPSVHHNRTYIRRCRKVRRDEPHAGVFVSVEARHVQRRALEGATAVNVPADALCAWQLEMLCNSSEDTPLQELSKEKIVWLALQLCCDGDELYADYLRQLENTDIVLTGGELGSKTVIPFERGEDVNSILFGEREGKRQMILWWNRPRRGEDKNSPPLHVISATEKPSFSLKSTKAQFREAAEATGTSPKLEPSLLSSLYAKANTDMSQRFIQSMRTQSADGCEATTNKMPHDQAASRAEASSSGKALADSWVDNVKNSGRRRFKR